MPILRRFPLAALLLLVMQSGARAQYLPSYVLDALDSALGAIAMTRSDFTMRYDAAGLDTHRLGVISRLFGDPLASFAVSDSIATVALQNTGSPLPFFDYVGGLLDLGEAPFRAERPIAADDEIALTTGIRLDSLDFTTATLLRRYLALAVATDAAMVSTRGAIGTERLQGIVSYIDSLILQSEGGGEASLVEMKQAERYYLARGKRFFNEETAGLDHARLLAPGVTQFLMALNYAQGMRQELARLGASIRTTTIRTPLGMVAIGGPGNDIYDDEDLFCIIDVGGNDIYRPRSRSKQQAFDRSTTLIVDFAGNDTYAGDDYIFGGTIFGASTLIDLEGDDVYSARNFAIGCGLFGTGVLYDGAGSDRYSGGTAVQGAGIFGIGVLYDIAGNDNYLAHLASQGFGYTRGVGAIVDAVGNDSYLAASPYTDYLRYDDHFETFCQGAALGARPTASAGIGIIVEGGGSDIYNADIFGQGTAYWFGLGAIVDRTGNDTYSAFQYAQGSGVHLAFGVLMDTSGNDNYISHGVSQGCGHDIAFGGLYDARGDDNYVVESLSLGGGNADALSLFVDAGGEDGYLARRDNTLGYSDLRREYGMIGIFLDLEKKDFYGTSRGGNDSLWTGSYYGAGLDGELRPSDPALPPGSNSPVAQKTPEEIERELAKDVETLFIQASAAPQKWQFIVPPAQKRLIEMGDTSLPFLLRQLDTESPREALALGRILPKMGVAARDALIDTVLHGEISRVGRALYALGEMRDTAAAMAIATRLVDSSVSWRMRAAAGEAILKLRAPQIRPLLREALRDSFELVRGYATRALLMVADSVDFLETMRMLEDPSQIVRYQVQLAIQRRTVDSLAGPFVAALLARPQGVPNRLLLPLASKLTVPWARERLFEGLLDQGGASRAAAVRLAREWNDPALVKRALELKRRESDPAVLRELELIGEVPTRGSGAAPSAARQTSASSPKSRTSGKGKDAKPKDAKPKDAKRSKSDDRKERPKNDRKRK